MSTYVVIGSGPVGSGSALELANRGHRVKVATRRGTGPAHPNVELHRVDATSETGLAGLATGASAILNCANPPYTSWDTDWPPIAEAVLGAAKSTGAAVITMSNLYGHGPAHQLMTASTPLDSTGKKGRVRAEMWRNALAAHRAGYLQAAEVRASDFFGPEVVGANMGERVLPRILGGKGLQLLGKLDVEHSFSYMPDVVAVLATVATDEGSWGRPWMVPSVNSTQRSLVELFSRAAGKSGVKISTIPSIALKAMGLVAPTMRELAEVEYQFSAPFTVDATDTTDRFGIRASDIHDSARATVEWWQTR